MGQSLSGTEDKCLDRAEGGLYSDADFTFPSSWEASVSPEGGRGDPLQRLLPVGFSSCLGYQSTQDGPSK